MTTSFGEGNMLQSVCDVAMTHELNGFEDLSKVHILFADNVKHLIERVGFESVENCRNLMVSRAYVLV